MISPKHKFFGTIHLVISQSGSQSTSMPISASGESINDVKSKLKSFAEANKHVYGDHPVVIKKNRLEYPEFDWMDVEKSEMTL